MKTSNEIDSLLSKIYKAVSQGGLNIKETSTSYIISSKSKEEEIKYCRKRIEEEEEKYRVIRDPMN